MSTPQKDTTTAPTIQYLDPKDYPELSIIMPEWIEVSKGIINDNHDVMYDRAKENNVGEYTVTMYLKKLADPNSKYPTKDSCLPINIPQHVMWHKHDYTKGVSFVHWGDGIEMVNSGNANPKQPRKKKPKPTTKLVDDYHTKQKTNDTIHDYEAVEFAMNLHDINGGKASDASIVKIMSVKADYEMCYRFAQEHKSGRNDILRDAITKFRKNVKQKVLSESMIEQCVDMALWHKKHNKIEPDLGNVYGYLPTEKTMKEKIKGGKGDDKDDMMLNIYSPCRMRFVAPIEAIDNIEKEVAWITAVDQADSQDADKRNKYYDVTLYYRKKGNG